MIIRFIPYLLAILCLIIMSSNILGQTVERSWRVTYYDETEQREVRSRPYSLSDCIRELSIAYQRERVIYLYCTADKLERYEDEKNEQTNSTATSSR